MDEIKDDRTKTDPFGSLSDFKPKTPSVPMPDPAPVKKLAEEHGFAINNLEERRRVFRVRKRSRAPKTEAITIRVRVHDWNKFQQYCEKNDYTVADGFAELTATLPPVDDVSLDRTPLV
jgi:hypothetical protein